MNSAVKNLPDGTPIGFDTILDGLPDAIALVNRAGRLVYVNQSAEQFFRSSSAVLTRQTIDAIFPFGSPILNLVNAVMRNGASVREYGVDLGTPKIGGPARVDVQVSPLMDVPDHVMIIIQHRSVARKMDRQLTHRGAARAVTGMAAVLAHEIKNPLLGIRGAAQLLEQGVGEEDRELTKLICAETDRIRDLVDRMEVFSDERPLKREPVNIHSVLEHVKTLAVASFAAHARIVEEYDPSLPPVLGVRDQLIQVFQNLVKNAAESLPENGGEITITTAYKPGVRVSAPGSQDRTDLPLEVCVRDNGVGVNEDMKRHLFDPFVTNKANGTGLGLALVAKIIGDHGGVIECESEPKDTIFRVLLPIDKKASNSRYLTKGEE